MFDYRYHALSLAAVLLALAVGVVIGVAIGDSDLVSSAKTGLVHNLSAEVSSARNDVTQAGGDLATVVAVREPLDLPGVALEAAGTHYAAIGAVGATGATGATSVSEAETQLVERFGMLVGKQLVSGGQLVDQELLSRVRNRLLSAFDGQLGRLEGVVVMRSEPTELTPPQTQALASFQ